MLPWAGSRAELVIHDGNWVCVQSGEIIAAYRCCHHGRPYRICRAPMQRTLLAKAPGSSRPRGRYLVPGLLDAHMHVESGMVTVTEFVRAVAPRGTTGMFIDPHEMANVFGLKGVKLMVDEAARQPIHVWVQMPSCVPSAPGFETPGSIHRTEGSGGGHDLAGHHRARGDDEFPGRVQQRRQDAGRNGGYPCGQQDRSAGTMPRRIWACLSMGMWRAVRRTITRARDLRTRWSGPARGCGRCCAMDRRGMTSAHKWAQSSRHGHGPAALHPVHGRFTCANAGA